MKGAFWTRIRVLLQDEIGKELKDPQDTMTTMLIQHQIEEKREAKESGTVQNDSDLKQALRQWEEHVQVMEEEKKKAKKS